MRDFFIGTLGKLLQVVFTIVGLGFVLVSFGSFISGSAALGGLLLFIGIFFLCGIFGIRYALGHVIRHR